MNLRQELKKNPNLTLKEYANPKKKKLGTGWIILIIVVSAALLALLLFAALLGGALSF